MILDLYEPFVVLHWPDSKCILDNADAMEHSEPIANLTETKYWGCAAFRVPLSVFMEVYPTFQGTLKCT
jgi:hypothetical protein